MRNTLLAVMAGDLFSASSDPAIAVQHLPIVHFAAQRKHGVHPDAAAARLVFSSASMALGFAGDPLPSLFAAQGKAYTFGRDLRAKYDELVSASEAVVM